MRKSNENNGLTVHAIAGTYVVILGFDLLKDECDGLLGFSIHRQDHTENESYFMKGMKAFPETDPGLPAGSQYSTESQPWQGFQYADYSAKPDHRYTYTITALKGIPEKLISSAETKIEICTESVKELNHSVYFNRGTAASQEYERRFGDKRPDKVADNKAFEWLSRGIYEALELYINSCKPGKHSLRIAAYEFHYEKFLSLLKKTIDKGVDIRIIYDCRKEKGPKKKNRTAVKKADLAQYCIERTEGVSYISHNKFIVKLENDKPVSVWTGGMNFSENGIFGHSNVAHIITEGNVAESFFEYWKLLSKDLKTTPMKDKVEGLTPLPVLPESDGTKDQTLKQLLADMKDETCVFSPRKNLKALDLYHDLARSANEGIFMTFAFGINETFKDVYRNGKCPVRFALLEKKTRPLKEGSQEREEEEQEIQELRNMPENVFAVGDFVKLNKFDGWVKEKLSGLSTNVKYIHNKFLLIDPLGQNPVVITGSANFSDASTIDNDENMVIIKGNKRVADIYFGEFMRLFTHYTFRESLNWRKQDEPPKPLKTNKSKVKWWSDYFDQTPRDNLKRFFSQMEE